MGNKTVILNDEQYNLLIEAIALELATKAYHFSKHIEAFTAELKYDKDKKKNRAWAGSELNVIETRLKEIKESIDYYYTLKENK